MAPAYVALWIGLEKLVNTSPNVPEDIMEIKDIEYKNVGGKSLQLDIYRPTEFYRILSPACIYSRWSMEGR